MEYRHNAKPSNAEKSGALHSKKTLLTIYHFGVHPKSKDNEMKYSVSFVGDYFKDFVENRT